jgi:hypothetical protein
MACARLRHHPADRGRAPRVVADMTGHTASASYRQMLWMRGLRGNAASERSGTTVIAQHGYAGGITQVKEAVARHRRHHQEVFVPLSGGLEFTGVPWIVPRA